MTMKMMMAIQLMNSINLTFKIYFDFQKREGLLLNVPGEESKALSNESEDIFVKEFSVACEIYWSRKKSRFLNYIFQREDMLMGNLHFIRFLFMDQK